MRLSMHAEQWPAIIPFRISGHTFEHFDSVVVEIEHEGYTGRGEALGVYYLGESSTSMLAQLEPVVGQLESIGLDRQKLQDLLPPGGARNALDCALWDLEAKRRGVRAWELAGLAPRILQTVFTIGIESSAEAMAAKAAAARSHPLLKIKLDAHEPLERLTAIRAARPDARLVVDANQGWTFAQLARMAPRCAELEVEMIEQPLPRGADDELQDYRSPVPLCADESCLHLGELEHAVARYQRINIKLDKTGGLTHALELARAARARGLGLMVGCMAGGSLAMAPAVVLGFCCDLVDVDGPLLQKYDRPNGIRYQGGNVEPFDTALWG
jgi:L-alanine-DL-glutamate epimerase-like enolase superfamily enzyme